MLRQIRKIKYRIFILWLSIKWMFRVNLGDAVWYEGKKYIVSNGVRCDSWRLGYLVNDDVGWVKRSECKKVISWFNFMNSFKSGKSFYMSNWYSIWVDGGVKNWMKHCHIW